MGMSVDEIRLIEPARQFLWDIRINAPVSSNTLEMRVKSASIPQKANEVLEINYKAGKTSFTGRDSSSHTWNCIFWDDTAMSVYTTFNEWVKLQYNELDGRGTTKATYTGTAVLIQRDGTGAKIAEYYLDGLFIEDLSEIPLSYDSNEAIEVTVTFRFDKCMKK